MTMTNTFSGFNESNWIKLKRNLKKVVNENKHQEELEADKDKKDPLLSIRSCSHRRTAEVHVQATFC